MKGTISQLRQGETDIHAEQVRMLYEGAPTSALANVVNAAVLTFLLWDVIPHTALQGWLGAMFLLQVFRLALTRLYQSAQRLSRSEQGPGYAGSLHRFTPQNARWEQWYLATVAASGLIWGVAGFWLFPPKAPVHQLALGVILGGTVSGATAVLASLRWAFPLFALPVLMPLSARFLLEGTLHYLTTGILMLIFMLVLMNVSRRIHSTIVSAIKLRLENKELMAALTVKANDLQQINRLLKTEIHGHTQAADQLRDRSFFLQQLIDAIPNPVFYKGLDGVYQGCNEAMAKFFGISKTGFAGKTVFNPVSRESAEEHARQDREILTALDLVSRESAEEYARQDLELLQRGGMQVYEMDVLAADGARRHMLFHKTVLRDALDRPIGILGTLADLTDWKQSENS